MFVMVMSLQWRDELWDGHILASVLRPELVHEGDSCISGRPVCSVYCAQRLYFISLIKYCMNERCPARRVLLLCSPSHPIWDQEVFSLARFITTMVGRKKYEGNVFACVYWIFLMLLEKKPHHGQYVWSLFSSFLDNVKFSRHRSWTLLFCGRLSIAQKMTQTEEAPLGENTILGEMCFSKNPLQAKCWRIVPL